MPDGTTPPDPRHITTRVLNTRYATVEQADGPVYVVTSNWVRDLAEASPWQVLRASITAGVGLSGGALALALSARFFAEAFRMITP